MLSGENYPLDKFQFVTSTEFLHQRVEFTLKNDFEADEHCHPCVFRLLCG